MNHKQMRFVFISLIAIISFSCNEGKQAMDVCVPDYIDERYRFCIYDPLELIKKQGAVLLDQGQYKVTENELYSLDLNNSKPFVYAEFEIKADKIVVASYRTFPMDYEIAQKNWENYVNWNNNFYNIQYEDVNIPVRLAERLIKDVTWVFPSNGLVRMQYHLISDGNYVISLEISIDQ